MLKQARFQGPTKNRVDIAADRSVTETIKEKVSS